MLYTHTDTNDSHDKKMDRGSIPVAVSIFP